MKQLADALSTLDVTYKSNWQSCHNKKQSVVKYYQCTRI